MLNQILPIQLKVRLAFDPSTSKITRPLVVRSYLILGLNIEAEIFDMLLLINCFYQMLAVNIVHDYILGNKWTLDLSPGTLVN